MKRKIMIAAVAAAVIFAVIAILSVLAQTPALIEMICCEISGGSWKDWKTGVSQMILPVFIQKIL